jgi:hypothetical protein
MTNISPWGRPIPTDKLSSIESTWGARAILQQRFIDIVWDRQGWNLLTIDELRTERERKAKLTLLTKWVNKKGLPWLRKQVEKQWIDGSDTIVLTLDDGLFHIEASPQASYGYLYIRAWRYKDPPPPIRCNECGQACYEHSATCTSAGW